MSSLLEKKLRTFPSDYLSYTDLVSLLPLSENARYAQIKRALKEGILHRLHKGLYLKGHYLQKQKPDPFEMSQAILSPSYVSLESALSYHGLIPEAVYSTTCVTTKKSCTVKNNFGVFSYQHLPNNQFYLGVTREEENHYIFLVATPWKALTDYLYCYKKNWIDMTPLAESLRIDIDSLPKLDKNLKNSLENYYNNGRIHRFLNGVRKYYNEY